MLIGDVWITAELADEVAALTGSSARTVRRWMQRKQLPPAVEALLDLVQNGRLGRISDAWCGWRLSCDELVSPEGMTVKPGEIRALAYRYHYIAALELGLREIRAERDALLAQAGKPTAKLYQFPVVTR